MATFFSRRSLVAVVAVSFGLLPSAAFAQDRQYDGQYDGQYNNADNFPRKGVEAGFGGSASDGSSALPLALGGGAALAVAAGGTGLALRRRRG